MTQFPSAPQAAGARAPIADPARDALLALRTELGKAVVGQDGVVSGLVIAELITGGALLALLAGCGSWLIGRGLAPLNRMASTADLITSNGDLTVGRADANVTGKSANGEIRIGQVSSGTVEIKTSNGEIEIGVRAGTAARLDLFTSFGRVRNTLNPADTPDPAGAPLAILARTSHGDITIRPA